MKNKYVIKPKSSMKLLWIYIALNVLIHIAMSIFEPRAGCGDLNCNFFYKYVMLQPMDLENSFGIISASFLHSSWPHLMGNMFFLVLIGVALKIWFEKVEYKILLPMFIVFAGLFTFVFGKHLSVHLGASGVVYAIVCYTIVRGALSNNLRQLQVAGVAFIMYGQALLIKMVPQVKSMFAPNISWEMHLGGAIIGVIMGFTQSSYFKEKSKELIKKLI